MRILGRPLWSPLYIRRTTLLLALSTGVLGGLIMARTMLVVPLWVTVLCGIVAITVRRQPVACMGLLTICGFGLGLWHGARYMESLRPYRDMARRSVVIVATVSTDAVYADKGQLSFDVKNINFVSPQQIHAPGTIKISGYGELAVYRGDTLRITGKLYPTRGAKQAAIGFAQFERLGAHPSPIDTMLRKFKAGIQTALPEPQASFALGLLVGQRNTLPDDTTQALKMVGLAHIIAVSGYNLTILIEMAKRVLTKHSKRFVIIGAFSLIAVFMLCTGMSASIVRAAVISTLSLMAWYYGRTVRPLVLILGAAALTAYANPIYLWSDIGWYLSFLAFAGILLLAPVVAQRLYRHKKPPALVQVAIETACAEIMTMPLIMFIFGQVSVVGILANVLVVTLIPLAMLGCFVCGIVGAIAPTLVGWIAWPTKLLVTYMLDTAQLLSQIPHVFQTNKYLSVVDMVVCYVVITAIIAVLYNPRTRLSNRLE